MLYREATHADLPVISSLGDEVNAMHHLAEPHVFASGGDPMRHSAHWETTIGQKSTTTFLALAEDRVVGFATVTAGNETHSLLQPVRFGRIGTVGVNAQYRGQGIGNCLMELAEKWAKAQGCTEIRLTVGTFNERALRLYEERGYEERSRQLVRSLGEALYLPEEGS
jgi:ribosomal protein S18 acetylase RimI-like enzyme